jgi:hypothetical protein
VGVDRIWEDSDQKHWFIKCSGCNKEDFITLNNIVNNQFVCLKCGKELERRHGRWVKRWRDKETSGYWIPLLICPWVSAAEIKKKELSGEMTEEQFTNFVMGRPFVGRGNILTKPLLYQNLVNEINPQDEAPIIGVDTGETIWYVIGNKHGIYYHGSCKDYSELEGLMNRYPKAKMVIDQGGDIIGPRKLREKFGGRVFLCYFTGNRNNDSLIQWDDEDGSVTADRDRVIQLVVDEFTERRIPLWGTEADFHDYWMHWSRLYRTSVENALGVQKHHWEKSNTPCDYPFATVYWRIGMDRFMDQTAQIIMPGGEFGKPGYEENLDGRAFIPKLTR